MEQKRLTTRKPFQEQNCIEQSINPFFMKDGWAWVHCIDGDRTVTDVVRTFIRDVMGAEEGDYHDALSREDFSDLMSEALACEGNVISLIAELYFAYATGAALWERLVQYEDTGLSPKEVKVLLQEKHRKQEADMDDLRFTIPLNPVSKKNSQQIIRIGNRPKIVPSKAYRKYEKQVAEFMPFVAQPISKHVEVTALFYMKTDYERAKSSVDLPNLLEAIDDILVKYKVLAEDNSRVIVSHDGSRVLYDKESPRTEVEIRRIG